MKTIPLTLYTFDELSDKAKEKALNDHRDINCEGVFPDWDIQDMEKELEAVGYVDPDIQCSGFYSQGDGASFTATIDIDKWIEANTDHKNPATPFRHALAAIGKGTLVVDFKIIRLTSHYVHSETIRSHFEITHDERGADTDALVEEELEALADLIDEDARTRSVDIFKRLQDEYEFRTSDDAVADTLLSNEYTFEANGTMRNE